MTTTYSFKEIGDMIYTKMLEVKNTDKRVGDVFNYDVKIENGINLPAIIITPTNGNIEILDTCSYENSINFTVRLFDRISDGMATVEDNMRIVADMVINRLKEIGTITYSNSDGITVKSTFSYMRGFADTQEPLRVFQVDCKFVAVEG